MSAYIPREHSELRSIFRRIRFRVLYSETYLCRNFGVLFLWAQSPEQHERSRHYLQLALAKTNRCLKSAGGVTEFFRVHNYLWLAFWIADVHSSKSGAICLKKKQKKNNHLTWEVLQVTFLRDRMGRLFVSHSRTIFFSFLSTAVDHIEHSSSTDNEISIACAVAHIFTTKRLSERYSYLYVVCTREVCVLILFKWVRSVYIKSLWTALHVQTRALIGVARFGSLTQIRRDSIRVLQRVSRYVRIA